MEEKGEQIVNMAVKTNYLEIPKKQFVKLGECEAENLVVLIVGTNNEPYYLVERILEGKLLLLPIVLVHVNASSKNLKLSIICTNFVLEPLLLGQKKNKSKITFIWLDKRIEKR